MNPIDTAGIVGIFAQCQAWQHCSTFSEPIEKGKHSLPCSGQLLQEQGGRTAAAPCSKSHKLVVSNLRTVHSPSRAALNGELPQWYPSLNSRTQVFHNCLLFISMLYPTKKNLFSARKKHMKMPGNGLPHIPQRFLRNCVHCTKTKSDCTPTMSKRENTIRGKKGGKQS